MTGIFRTKLMFNSTLQIAIAEAFHRILVLLDLWDDLENVRFYKF